MAAVAVDLTDSGGGINIRLEMGADEAVVLERVRELLATYGARSQDRPPVRLGRARYGTPPDSGEGATRVGGTEVTITPLGSRARIEVFTANVRSFRIVPGTPKAIAQGLSDAWCQVIGRVPVEIVDVERDEQGRLRVTASHGTETATATASPEEGWARALTMAVGGAIGAVDRSAAGNPIAVGG